MKIYHLRIHIANSNKRKTTVCAFIVWYITSYTEREKNAHNSSRWNIYLWQFRIDLINRSFWGLVQWKCCWLSDCGCEFQKFTILPNEVRWECFRLSDSGPEYINLFSKRVVFTFCTKAIWKRYHEQLLHRGHGLDCADNRSTCIFINNRQKHVYKTFLLSQHWSR